MIPFHRLSQNQWKDEYNELVLAIKQAKQILPLRV